MKQLKIFLFLLTVSFISCDDGDIIVTSFEFDDATLQLCEGSKENEFVFFKINRDLNEAISFNFIDPTFSEEEETTDPIIIQLDNSNNSLIYRQFNVSVADDYFCSSVPPSDIIVTEEFVSTQGRAQIVVQIIEEDDNDGVDPIVESGGIDPVADNDNDKVPNYRDQDDRGDGKPASCVDTSPADGICDTLGLDFIFDADRDGIPNYKDQDDDNDNILTSVEFPDDDPDTDIPRDTDGDKIPDYLDNDDDGDGVLTNNEDTDGNGNPRDDNDDINDDDPNNDDNLFNYLDSESTASNPTPPSLSNTVRTTFRSTVSITDLMFNANNNTLEDNTFSFGNRDITISITDEEN